MAQPARAPAAPAAEFTSVACSGSEPGMSFESVKQVSGCCNQRMKVIIISIDIPFLPHGFLAS